MRKYLQSICMVILAVALVLGISTVNVKAEDDTDSSSTSYQVYIDDQADLLTDAEEKELYNEMSELTEYGNMMFTTVKLTDSNYQSYGQDAYYEKFGNEPGVNFQIDMGNRQLTLCCSTKMEDELGSERDSIVDNIYTYATDKQYKQCASECFHEINQVLHKQQIAHKMKHINNAIIALILGLMLNLIFVFMTISGKKSYKNSLAGSIVASMVITEAHSMGGRETKKYTPHSSDSGGGGFFSGGGSSGGGGGGGGFSGGSSSHGF